MDKVSAYRECATVFLDMPELIAVRRRARIIATTTVHAPREYVHVMPDGKENRAVRYIVKMIVRGTEFANLEVPVSATKTLQERRAAFRPVRWQTTKFVAETDDVWTVRSLSLDTTIPLTKYFHSKTGKCTCHDGYKSSDCSLTVCPNSCSEHGVCQDFKCQCSPGWESHDCSVKKCPELCESHGRCMDGTCICGNGWSNFPGGNSCQKAVCEGAPDCHGHGVCAPDAKTKKNKCHCENPWTIESLCAEKSCPDDCSQNGQCNNGTCACT